MLDALNAQNKPASPEKQEDSFFRTMTAAQYKETAPGPKAAFPAAKAPVGSYTVRPKIPAGPGMPDLSGRTARPSAPAGDTGRREPARHDAPPPPPAGHAGPETAESAPVQQSLTPVRESPWRIAGEVLKTYIVCESESSDVWLIDTPAAHARIRFDELKANPEPLMAQALLTPLAVTLEADAYGAVLENLDLLQQFGFACEDFGGSTVLAREIPADIRPEDAPATLEELGRKLVLGRADPAGARDELLHTMACKSAIKAGMDTSPAEMRALVEKVQSGQIQYCPHGRPVKHRLTKYEIEKMFKRA